jgi:hypothetical protein
LAALGAEVTLATSFSSEFDREALQGLHLLLREHSELPRYANSYDRAGNRTQLLLAPGDALELDGLVPRHYSADAVMVAPAFHEVRSLAGLPATLLVAVSLQGPLRAVAPDQRIIPHTDPFGVARKFIRPGRLAFFSEEDTPEPERLARHVTTLGATAILTRGYNGATLFASDGSQHHWEAIPADPVDPTGAGDCFASAFLFRLAETNDLAQAMRFALAAGALAVEGNGLLGVATREAIEARMTREAA